MKHQLMKHQALLPISSGLTKDEVLERFKEVFTGLGRA